MKFDVWTNTMELENCFRTTGFPQWLIGQDKRVGNIVLGCVLWEWIPPAYPGILLQIDTGNYTPIWSKLTRYGPYYYDVMRKLVERLDNNGVVE